MATPYIGEIRMAGFNFAPEGWAFCDGSLLPISENPALFQLLGTTYGGDGQSTFALPDLRGRVPIHQGNDGHGNPYIQGQSAGAETVSLTGAQVPAHSHPFLGTSAAGASSAPTTGSVPAAVTTTTEPIYAPDTSTLVTMTATNQNAGGQPHDNLMPFVCVNFIVALVGVYPSQS